MGFEPDRRSKGERHQRRIIAGVAVAAAVVGLAAVSPVLGGDTVLVDARDAVDNPADVEAQLRDRDIDAEVWTAPTIPYLRGKWLHLYFPRGGQVDPVTFGELQSQVGLVLGSVVDRCGEDLACERVRVLEIPTDINTPIVLIAGRAPNPGERGWRRLANENELAPTGAFYCDRLASRSPAAAGRLLEQRGYRVRWQYDKGPSVGPGGVTTKPAEPPPATEITNAWFPGPNIVVVHLTDDEYADAYQRSAGTPVPGSEPDLSWAPRC